MELFYRAVLLLTLLSNAHGCPEFCTCSLFETKCSYADCEGDLPYEETYVLEIHGKLCEVRRELLSTSPSFANTLIRLHDDFCIDIPNCRSRVQVTTEFPRQRIVPPPLPKDPDDIYEFGHEPIEEEMQQVEEEDALNGGNDQDDDDDENTATTSERPSTTESITDSPTTSEENDTVAEPSWLSRRVSQIGFGILGVVGVCLLLGTIILYCLYRKVRKSLRVLERKSKTSDEDLSNERRNETKRLVNDDDDDDEEKGAVGGVSRQDLVRMSNITSSDESVVFDKTVAAAAAAAKRKRSTSSRKEE